MERNVIFENARLKFELLQIRRPGAFRTTGWHRTLRVLYFISGIICSIFSVFMFTQSFNTYIVIKAMKRTDVFSYATDHAFMIEDFLQTIFPVEFALALVLLFLSIVFFMLARYCKKVIRRNLYIGDMERIWEEMIK